MHTEGRCTEGVEIAAFECEIHLQVKPSAREVKRRCRRREVDQVHVTRSIYEQSPPGTLFYVLFVDILHPGSGVGSATGPRVLLAGIEKKRMALAQEDRCETDQ